MLILEGPDGSGKSILAQRFRRTFGVEVRHSGGPPDSREEARRRFEAQLGSFGEVLDRCVCVSEMVYGNALRDGPIIPERELWEMFDDFVSGGWLMVYCRPPDEALLRYVRVDMMRVIEETRKTHKPPEHARLVQERMGAIIREYDRVMEIIETKGMVVLRYVRPQLDVRV